MMGMLKITKAQTCTRGGEWIGRTCSEVKTKKRNEDEALVFSLLLQDIQKTRPNGGEITQAKFNR